MLALDLIELLNVGFVDDRVGRDAVGNGLGVCLMNGESSLHFAGAVDLGEGVEDMADSFPG